MKPKNTTITRILQLLIIVVQIAAFSEVSLFRLHKYLVEIIRIYLCAFLIYLLFGECNLHVLLKYVIILVGLKCLLSLGVNVYRCVCLRDLSNYHNNYKFIHFSLIIKCIISRIATATICVSRAVDYCY